ncbi:MAG: hypothetical protein HY062_15330 [Bacteroidetes bacterium]|nr:hypothetical protein [Bacteroidota bacterium]
MNRKIKYTLVILFVVIANKGFTQDTLNSATVEEKSYQLYLDKQWPELISFGNKAVHKGFDYFYLRMRIGIAYYERKNYSLAEKHFKKALAFNAGDELALEYLYYCYVFNGRYDDARLLSKQFPSSLAEKIGTDKQSSVGFVILEGGTKITDKKTYPNKDSKNPKANYFDPPVYAQVGLSHSIKNRVSLFHALTYFNQKTFVNTVNQYQYYLKGSVPLKGNFSIAGSVHYINLKVASESKYTVTDTLWPPGVPPHSQPPPGAPPYKTATTSTTIANSSQSNYFVGSLAAYKTIQKWTFGLGTTVSNMSNVTQYIHSGSLSYAAFGNSKLVLGCTAYVHTVDNYSTTELSPAPFIYIQPIHRLSLKISYLSNTNNNIIEDNGYLVNNSPDLTKTRYSALLNVTLTKHVALYGLYQLEYKHEAQQAFDYRYNVIVAGVKIIP